MSGVLRSGEIVGRGDGRVGGTAQDGESGASRMTLFMRRCAAQGRSVLDLSYGYPYGLMPAWITEAARSLAANGWEDIDDERCVAALRLYFARRFGGGAVTLTNSASEAILLAFDAVLGPSGGEILAFDLTFDAYDGIARMCRGRVRRVPRSEPGGRPDVARMVPWITAETRALLLTQPENPLGWIHDPDQIAAAIEIARRHGLALVVDCAFADVLPWGGRVPPVADDDVPVLIIGDTGKLIGLHGLRIGALIHAPRMSRALEAATSSLFLRLDSPRLGTLAQIVDDPRLEAHRQALGERVRSNFAVFAEVAGPGVVCRRPEATSMAIVTVPGCDLDDLDLAGALLAEEQVACVPLSMFTSGVASRALPEAASLRVALARPESTVREAAVRLRRFLARRGLR